MLPETSEAATAGSLVPAEETGGPTAEDNIRSEDPIMVLVLLGVCLYALKLWWDDLQAYRKGKPNEKAFPGATPCGRGALVLAVVGSLILLGLETVGEYALGISDEQSKITWLFLISMITAAFVEELVFRGFLVVTGKGTAAVISVIVGFSLLFAILHPHLWSVETPEGVAGWQFWAADWSLHFTTKAWFSTTALFVGSLWFYICRFNPLNPLHSLFPCIAAHLVKNIGVFVIKLAQGHVVGLY